MELLKADIEIKELLGEIAAQVGDLPVDLRSAAFSTLLSHRLGSRGVGRVSAAPGASQKVPGLALSAGLTFGDVVAKYRRDIREDEKLLIAVTYMQDLAEDSCASIEDAHTALKDVGIKLSNVSVFAKQLQKKKFIFAVGKSGQKTMKFRTSVEGRAALEGLVELVANQ